MFAKSIIEEFLKFDDVWVRRKCSENVILSLELLTDLQQKKYTRGKIYVKHLL